MKRENDLRTNLSLAHTSDENSDVIYTDQPPAGYVPLSVLVRGLVVELVVWLVLGGALLWAVLDGHLSHWFLLGVGYAAAIVAWSVADLGGLYEGVRRARQAEKGLASGGERG